MDIISVIRDEEERDLFFIQEGTRDMANFVRIGKRVVNLDNVTEIHLTPHGGASYQREQLIVSFIGSGEYIAIDRESEPESFTALQSWMDEQVAFLLPADEE